MDTNRKRLLLLAAALAALAGFAIAVRFLPAYFSGRDRMVPAAPERIASVRFSHQLSSQTLERKNGRWDVITNGRTFPADASRVDSLLLSIVGLSRDSIVSRNPDNHAKFGIGNDKMIIRADREYTVYLGKTEGDDRYVRAGSGNDVYLARGFAAPSSLADYRDLSLKAVTDMQAVSAFTVRRNGGSFTLKKRNGSWFSGDTIVNGKNISVYLDSLKDVRAASIANDPPAPGIPEYLAVTIKEKEEETTVVFYEKDDATLFAKNSRLSYYFVVPRVYAASLDKTLEEFIETPKVQS